MSSPNNLQALASDFLFLVPMLKVLFALIVGFLWSFCLMLRGKTPVKWWQQHTTPMYIVLVPTLVCELSSFHAEVTAPHDQSWYFEHGNVTGDPTGCMDHWTNEVVLDVAHHSQWVFAVASVAPIFVTITFLMTAAATFKHVHAHGATPLWDQYNRFATIWILQLPLVYSVTALFSVREGLKQARLGGYACATGDNDPSFAFFIEAGLSFGDGYEAIALLLFADITMNVIEYLVDKTVEDAETSKAALVSIYKQLEDEHNESWFGVDNGALRSDLKMASEHIQRVMTRLEQMSEKLMHSTGTLSCLGIKYFAFTCLVIALPPIVACQAWSWGTEWAWVYDGLSAFSESWAGTFKGMGLLGSCVAIHNMVFIETTFDKAFLEGYTAKLKFISVKIMVSIVFMQEMVLPVAFNLSLPRANLFDAALRIIEFSFIAVFNLWAWPVEQAFYDMVAIDVKGMEDLTENLLEDGAQSPGRLSVTLEKERKSFRELA